MIDQGVFLMLGATGIALVAFGGLGIFVARLMRRDRQDNAPRRQVARGALSDPDLMAIAYAVREDRRRKVRDNRRFTGRAVVESRQTLNSLTDEWNRQAVVAAAELICKESAR